MCKKKQFKYCPSEIDECMKNLVKALNREGLKTYASCCGHERYPMTIIMKDEIGMAYDFISGRVLVGRKKKFYKKDKEGYYYIPETQSVDSGKLGGKS